MSKDDEDKRARVAAWREFRAADMVTEAMRHDVWNLSVEVGYTPVCLANILLAIRERTPLLVARTDKNVIGGTEWTGDLIYFYAFSHEPTEANWARNGGTLFVKGYSCAIGKFIKVPLTSVAAANRFTALPEDATFPRDEVSILNVEASLAYLRLAGETIE